MIEDAGRKRIKLNLEDLQVESFDTLPDFRSQRRGTVQGYATEGVTYCGENTCQNTVCQISCGDTLCATCGGPGQTCAGCQATAWCATAGCGTDESGCGSCHFTCTPACQSAGTYASCGGLCELTDCPGNTVCTLDDEYCHQV